MLFASSVVATRLPQVSGHVQLPAAATHRYHLKSRILARRPKNVPTCDRICRKVREEFLKAAAMKSEPEQQTNSEGTHRYTEHKLSTGMRGGRVACTHSMPVSCAGCRARKQRPASSSVSCDRARGYAVP